MPAIPDTNVAAYSGFEAKPGVALADWSSIASGWHNTIERALERCRWLDAPFVHAEHGNMHALMVAAELAGWTTFREVIGNRDNAEGPTGRLDGCFIGEATVDLVEAKASEFAIQPGGSLRSSDFKRCQRLMADAVVDAQRYFNRHGMFEPFRLPKRRVGIAFYYGYLPDSPPDGDPWLASYLATLRTIDHDVMAWSFPSQGRGLRYHGNRLYPGVVMLAKLAGEEPAAVMAADLSALRYDV